MSHERRSTSHRAAWTAAVAVSVLVWAVSSQLMTGSAGAADPAVSGTIGLHNAIAPAGTPSECPADGQAYWHFVLAGPGAKEFVTMTLNLGTTPPLFITRTGIIQNANKWDNVFVRVPAGYKLTDLSEEGSSAEYSGATPNQFNLSHTCAGTTTTTTSTSTTTTEPTTTTTTTSSSTTTEPATTTTTTSSSTTSTTIPDTSVPPLTFVTTSVPDTTTSTSSSTTIPDTSVPPLTIVTSTTAPPPAVLDSTTIRPPLISVAPSTAPPAQVLGISATRDGSLATTGSSVLPVLLAGLVLLLTGLGLVRMGRKD